MAADGRTLIVKNPLKGAIFHPDKSKWMKAASLATHFGLGFVTGCVRIFGDCGPFGVAMTARAGGGPGGLFCLLGACLGYVVSGGLAWALRYLAALILTFTASFVFRETKIQRRHWFMPCVSAAIMTLTGALNYFDRLTQFSFVVDLLTEVMLTGLAAYLFVMALTSAPPEREQDEIRRDAGGILLLCCALMALSRITIIEVLCIGRVMSLFCVMTAAFGGGASMGAFIGVLIGLAMDLSAGGMTMYTVCYGFAGLVSGTLKRQGRLFFLLIFLASHALAVLWNWENIHNVPALYEAFAASVIFMILPAKLMTIAVSTVQKPSPGTGEAGLRLHTAKRTRELSEAFLELYETVRRSAESTANDEDVATIYDRAAGSVCAGCMHKGECWHQNYVDTLTMLNDATNAMRYRGHLETGDLPERFREKCPEAASFAAAVNAELRALTYRQKLRSRMEENRLVAYGQYRYLAGVLQAVSDDLSRGAGGDALAERRLLRYLNAKDIDAEVSVFRDQSGRLHAIIKSARLMFLYKDDEYIDRISEALGTRMCRPASMNREEARLVLLEAEPLAVSVGVAATKKEGERVSGDRGTYFKTEQGVLCVLLSDGMGSGENAARESISTLRILERFLRAGVEPGTSMKLLNSVMLLKNGDEWGYATVDLMCIDLFTGQTGFYKYGAAPSYIRSGKTIRRVKGQSMAAGILSEEGAPPDVVRMRLKPGGVAIIASDGVVTKEDDGWLRKLLADFEGNDTRELARCVIREAGKQYGYTDDMTVLAVRVEERK